MCQENFKGRKNQPWFSSKVLGEFRSSDHSLILLVIITIRDRSHSFSNQKAELMQVNSLKILQRMVKLRI